MIAWYLPPHIGGVEVVAAAWAKALTNHDWHVKVMSSTPVATASLSGGSRVLCEPHLAPDPGGREDPGPLIASIEREISTERPNLVVTHQLAYPLAPRKSFAVFEHFFEAGLPVLEVAHNAHLRDPALSRRLLMMPMAAMVAVSSFVRVRVRALGYAGPCLVLHNPCDTRLFTPSAIRRRRLRSRLQLGPDARAVLFPSRLFDIDGTLSVAKDAKLALDAFTEGARRNHHLHLVFAQPINGFLSARLRRLGVAHRTRWPSVVTQHQDMPGIYDASDLVLVSSVEGFGLVYAEAMAMAKSLVALSVGAAPEIIGRHGRLEPPEPRLSLGRRLGQRLAETADLSHSARHQQARTHVLRHFAHSTWAKRVDEICRAVKLAAEKDRTPAPKPLMPT